MTKEAPKYALPARVESLMAVAARHFKMQGQTELVSILANSRVEIVEGVDHDNWDGGQTGHEIVFHLPEPLFHLALDGNDYGSSVREVLNRLANVPHEYIAVVSVHAELAQVVGDWRKETGALLVSPTLVEPSTSDLLRLWSHGTPRVFLSHRADFKIQAKKVKDELGAYGIAAFVAHEDIAPTRTWQAEIERALASMDILVAILSNGFEGSYWTNQEIGVALGRGTPVVALRLDEDPRGFIGNSQAVNGRGKSEEEWAKALARSFSEYPQLRYSLQAGLVQRWERASSYKEASRLMRLLDEQVKIPSDLLARIEAAYEENRNLQGAWAVQDGYPAFRERMRSNQRK